VQAADKAGKLKMDDKRIQMAGLEKAAQIKANQQDVGLELMKHGSKMNHEEKLQHMSQGLDLVKHAASINKPKENTPK